MRRMPASLQVCFRFSVKRAQADFPSPSLPVSSLRPQMPSDAFSAVVLLSLLLILLPFWSSLSLSVFLLLPAAAAVLTRPCLSQGRKIITSTELIRNKPLEICFVFLHGYRGKVWSREAGRTRSGRREGRRGETYDFGFELGLADVWGIHQLQLKNAKTSQLPLASTVIAPWGARCWRMAMEKHNT